MKYSKLYLRLYLSLLCMAALASCENTEETFEEFIQGGIISNIGAPISVTSEAGTELVNFKLAIPADPRVARGAVEWIEGGTSPMIQEFDIVRTGESGVDTIDITLSNVQEGIQQFNFTLFDNLGNASKALRHTRPIYGAIYESGLLPRRIDNAEAFAKIGYDSVIIKWSIAIPEMMESTLTYTDLDGIEQQIVVPADVDTTKLIRYDRTIPFSVVTRYIPEPNALNTYLSISVEDLFPKVILPLDKMLWSLEPLNNDVPEISATFNLNHAWDGIEGNYGATLGGDVRPHHFTIDLGLSEPVQLAEFSWAGFPPFTQVEVRSFQVWGIDDITGAETTLDIAADRDAWEVEMVSKGWTKLVENIRVQGQEDYSTIISNTTNVKFVRIVIVDSFLPSNPDIAWGEINIKAFL